jgi:hypothetical protein
MKIRGGGRGDDGILGFHLQFDIRHNYDGTVVSSTLRPHFMPKETLWYSFLLEAEWTPGLLFGDRRDRSLGDSQGPYRE